MEEDDIVAPASPKQEMMLNQNCDFAILGGAAGSGKSFVLLLYPLKYSNDPYFRGIIFRKTTGEITGQGGLWETAIELYTKVFGDKLRIHKKELRITFPAGGSVKFSYLERPDDRFRHQGNQYSLIGFDEGTHFDKESISYLQTRLRSAKAKHKLQVVITCNPDPDWEYLDFVKPYLQEDGTPDLSKDGKIRYYIIINNEYIFSDDLKSLQEKYGYGEDSGIKSYTFISATCTDNPPLLKNVPGYVGELKSKPFIDMQRLLLGNWYVRPTGSTYFQRDWCEEVDWVDEAEVIRTVRAFDFAGSLKNDINPSPDYTVGVRMRLMKDGTYIIDSIIRTRVRPGDWLEFALQACESDPVGTTIIIPEDPNPAAKRASMMFARDLADYGFYVKRVKTNKSKLDRFRPFSSQAQNGGVKFLSNCGVDLENKIFNSNDFIYKELEVFDGTRKRGENGHDDICDAISDSYYMLASDKTKIADISKALSGFANNMRESLGFPT